MYFREPRENIDQRTLLIDVDAGQLVFLAFNLVQLFLMAKYSA